MSIGLFFKKNKITIFLTMFLFLFFAQGLICILDKAPTCDEFAHHTASGYSHLVTGDFRMNPAAPPLPRLLSAIPLFFLNAKAPLEHWSWEKGDSPEFAQQFFYHANNRQDEFIFWARIPILILSVFFAFFVFSWSKQLWGVSGGFAALILYIFCPDLIAHSSLATSDISIAFFFYLSLWRFWKYLKKPTQKNMALCATFSGMCFLSKFSAVLLFPAMFLIALFSTNLSKISPKKIMLFLIFCFFTVWIGYFFEVKPLLLHTPDPPKKIDFLYKIGGDSLVCLAEKVPIPLSTFISAFGGMMFTRARGTSAFLMGEWSRHGWWYYYFVAFVIKNTIPLLVFFFSSLLCLRKLPLDRLTKIVLCVPIVLFFVITLKDKAQAGIRYFFPIYPFIIILASGAFAYFWNKKNIWLRAGLVVLLCWHAGESVAASPNQFSYFNEFVGGSSNGYKFLRDSNVDWGQDLKPLSNYVKKMSYDKIVLSSLSPVEISYYGINFRRMNSEEYKVPGDEVYAIGVHWIDSVEWAKNRIPDKIIGNSIHVYDLRKK